MALGNCKQLGEKLCLIDFVNFSAIFPPRVPWKTGFFGVNQEPMDLHFLLSLVSLKPLLLLKLVLRVGE